MPTCFSMLLWRLFNKRHSILKHWNGILCNKVKCQYLFPRDTADFSLLETLWSHLFWKFVTSPGLKGEYQIKFFDILYSFILLQMKCCFHVTILSKVWWVLRALPPTLAFLKHSPDCSHSDLNKAQMEECQRHEPFKALECFSFMFRKTTEHLHGPQNVLWSKHIMIWHLPSYPHPPKFSLLVFSRCLLITLPPTPSLESAHTFYPLQVHSYSFSCYDHFLKRPNLSASHLDSTYCCCNLHFWCVIISLLSISLMRLWASQDSWHIGIMLCPRAYTVPDPKKEGY